MIKFVLPDESCRGDVLSFYEEFEQSGVECIGCKNGKNYDTWLDEMKNRHDGKKLPDGYVREDFYLCYDGGKLVGVFSLKFELTDFLYNFGGHIGYAVRPSEQNKGYATMILHHGLTVAVRFGFDSVLCVCDSDNIKSERVIQKNGGVFENELYCPDEDVYVKRYWIKVPEKAVTYPSSCD